MKMLAEACHLGCLGEGDIFLGEIHCIELAYNGSASLKTSPPVCSSPCEEKSTALYNVKRNKNSHESPQSLIVLRCGLFTCSYVVLLEAVSIPRMLQLVAFHVRQVVRPWPVAFGH